MVWDELDYGVKEKQPTSAQHMWELLQDFLTVVVIQQKYNGGKRISKRVPERDKKRDREKSSVCEYPDKALLQSVSQAALWS